MNVLNLNRAAISREVWRRIYDNARDHEYYRRDLMAEITGLEELRKYADYDTGSINETSVWTLFSIACYFKPRNIVEVGTFIGKSTAALLNGTREAFVKDVRMFTCDVSNDIKLTDSESWSPGHAQLKQYQMASQTVFKLIADEGVRADLVHLDGRLTPADIDPLKEIVHDKTLFTLDDFEGLEKGVVNAQLLLDAFGHQYYLLIYPPEGCTTAMLLPRTLFALTAQ